MADKEMNFDVPSPDTDVRKDYFLGFYDLIDDDTYDEDWQFAIHHRSILELMRDRLTDAQRAQLDEIDAYWKARPEVFNKAFAAWHYRGDRKTDLEFLTRNTDGTIPEIPASHWWWSPLEVK